MTDLRQALCERILFFDGGMGTQLQAAGLTAGEAPELWSLTHPDAVTAIHRAYLEAGADILCANTFGVNGLRYPASHATPAALLVKAAVACAKRAVAEFEAAHADEPCGHEPHLVALDMGPTGKLMGAFGSMTADEATAAFGVSARAALEAGADLVAVETMNDVMEARAAVLAVHEYAPDLPVIATVVFSEQGTMLTGTDVSAAVTVLQSLGVDAVGLNCSLGPDKMKKLVPALCGAACVPVSVSPNAGLPVTVGGVTTYPCGPAQFAKEMTEVYAAGARILGGCCGTTPAHIQALREALKRENLLTPFTPAPVPALLTGRLHTVNPFLDGVTVLPVSCACDSALAEAAAEADYEAFGDAAMDADDEGADILLLSAAAPGVDEVQTLPAAVEAVQSVCPLPLILQSDNPAALEAALRTFGGRAGIRSDAPEAAALAARYGAVLFDTVVSQ